MTGSHIDTVQLGGRYDGALGILTALAALKSLKETHGKPKKSLEMVALCEEEDSRFHANFWGTRGILGLISAAEMDDLRDEAGVSIGEAMSAVGLDPELYADAIRDDLDAFVELHIEQGRILFDEDLPLGIVDAITGLYRFRVTVEGRTDHAGTTPRSERRDALAAAARLIVGAEDLAAAAEPDRPLTMTAARIIAKPNAPNEPNGVATTRTQTSCFVEKTAPRSTPTRLAKVSPESWPAPTCPESGCTTFVTPTRQLGFDPFAAKRSWPSW